MPTPAVAAVVLEAAPIKWDFLHRFITPLSAPLPSSLPGDVGALTVVQNDGQLSLSGGNLVFPAQSSAAFADQSICTAALTRRTGLALVLARLRFSTLADDSGRGFFNTVPTPASFNAAQPECIFFFNNSNNNGSRAPSLVCSGLGGLSRSTGLDYWLAFALRSAGSFVLGREGNSGTFKLLWVWPTGNAATVYAFAENRSDVGTLGAMGVTDLSLLDSRWANDLGIADSVTATTANGTTATSKADAFIEHTITAATGVDQELMVRRTDDNNCWIVRMAQAGSTIKLIEKDGGVETERASAAQTWTDTTTYRIVVTMEGTTIKTYVDTTAKNTYASASFNQTATGLKVSHAGTKLYAFPRTIALPARLDAFLAAA